MAELTATRRRALLAAAVADFQLPNEPRRAGSLFTAIFHLAGSVDHLQIVWIPQGNPRHMAIHEAFITPNRNPLRVQVAGTVLRIVAGANISKASIFLEYGIGHDWNIRNAIPSVNCRWLI